MMTIKRLLRETLLALFGVIAFTGCGGDSTSSDVNNESISLRNGAYSISIGANETSAYVDITSNCSWTVQITDNSNWQDLRITSSSSGSGNQNVNLSTNVNNTTSSRTAKLEFTKSSGGKVSFNITQEAGKAYLRVDPTPENTKFLGSGEKKEFKIESNFDWKVSNYNSLAEWCHIDKTEGKSGTTLLTVTVDENPGTTSREAQIELTGQEPATLKIIQSGMSYELNVGTDKVTVGAVGGDETTFTVKCNGKWNTNIQYKDGGSWCSINPSNGSATGSTGIDVKVVCQPNYSLAAREAIIIVIAGDNATKKEVKVEQEKANYPNFGGRPPQCREISSKKQEVTISFTSMFEVTECGFCLGTESEPTKEYQKEGVGGTSGTIKMELDVEEGTTYYVRAYAKSEVGDKINYSLETTFKTKGNQPGKDDNVSPGLKE